MMTFANVSMAAPSSKSTAHAQQFAESSETAVNPKFSVGYLL
jgi:hypothetical protein